MDRRFFAVALVLAALGTTFVARHRRDPVPNEIDFVSGLPALTPELKLVVAKVDFVKTVAAESPKVAWGVDWGTTRAALSVPVRAHYALDLSGPRPVEFRWDRGARRLTAVFPDPEVQAVEVATRGRRELVAPGWARFEALSGRSLLDGLEREVADRARADADAARARGRDAARPQLKRLLESYLVGAGRPAREVVVTFRSEEQALISAR